MSFPRAKPIDDLYAEVGGDDLVVVPNAPLAGASNRRVDHPHIVAVTP